MCGGAAYFSGTFLEERELGGSSYAGTLFTLAQGESFEGIHAEASGKTGVVEAQTTAPGLPSPTPFPWPQVVSRPKGLCGLGLPEGDRTLHTPGCCSDDTALGGWREPP